MKAVKKGLAVLMVVMILLVGCVEDGPTPTVSPLATPELPGQVGTDEGPAGAVELPGLDEVLGAVDRFFKDARLYAILGLIALDVVLGVAVALKTGMFDWNRLGDFYKTMVSPYVLGYLALYVVFQLLPEVVGMVGEVGNVAGEVMVTVAFATIAANLVASIWDHLKALGYKFGGTYDIRRRQ
jgi:hypothetical protein